MLKQQTALDFFLGTPWHYPRMMVLLLETIVFVGIQWHSLTVDSVTLEIVLEEHLGYPLG